MRKMIVGLLALASVSAFAQEIKVQTGDIVSIKNQSVLGLYYSLGVAQIFEDGQFSLKGLNSIPKMPKEMNHLLFVSRKGLCIEHLCVGDNVQFRYSDYLLSDRGQIIGFQLEEDQGSIRPADNLRKALIYREDTDSLTDAPIKLIDKL